MWYAHCNTNGEMAICGQFGTVLTLLVRVPTPVFTFVFVSAVGLVTAGLVSNLWAMITGSRVSLELLGQRDAFWPLRAIVLVISAPVLLLAAGFRELGQVRDGLLKWWITFPTAMGWAFVQGVVVVVALSRLS